MEWECEESIYLNNSDTKPETPISQANMLNAWSPTLSNSPVSPFSLIGLNPQSGRSPPFSFFLNSRHSRTNDRWSSWSSNCPKAQRGCAFGMGSALSCGD